MSQGVFKTLRGGGGAVAYWWLTIGFPVGGLSCPLVGYFGGFHGPPHSHSNQFR